MTESWWTGIDDAVMTCVAGGRAVTPAEIGARVGLSPEAVTSLICLLAQEGRVRICLVTAPPTAGIALAEAA